MVVKLLKYLSFKSEKDLSLLEVFRKFYVLVSFMGLFPFSIKLKAKHYCIINKQSIYLNCLRSVSIVLTLLTFFALHIHSIILATEGSSLTEAILTQINYILELINLASFCTVAYWSAFLNRYKFVDILNKLASAWMELPNDGIDIIKKLQISVTLTMFVLLMPFSSAVIINLTRSDSLWKTTLCTITFYLTNCIQFVMLAFYFVLVLMVITVLTKIEDGLKYFKEGKIYLECFTRVMPKPLPVTIKHLESAYVKSFEVKRSINEAFQACILITAAQSFHAIIGEAHIIYHGIVVQKNRLCTEKVVICSVWIFEQLLKISALAYSGNLLKNKVSTVGQVLYNISIERQDPRSLMEIQHFGSLITFQYTDITAYGLFPINATLLFNIVASATTYLIILVQFDRDNEGK